jgi:hypothetical protein
MLSLLFLMCSIDDSIADRIQQKLYLTPMTYCMGGRWPRCYDCWGILQKATRDVLWYSPPISSSWLYSNATIKKFQEAKRWDLLVQRWKETHVAFISKDYNKRSRTVMIYDYVKHPWRATERSHSFFSGIYVVDFNSIFK